MSERELPITPKMIETTCEIHPNGYYVSILFLCSNYVAKYEVIKTFFRRTSTKQHRTSSTTIPQEDSNLFLSQLQ